ncbi:MAG: hypothetical protein J5592_03875 [Clostridia bacterium]|nr:hypothetical protein [Clostridia bacterium]
MKRLTAPAAWLLLSLMLLGAFAACGDNNKKPPEPGSETLPDSKTEAIAESDVTTEFKLAPLDFNGETVSMLVTNRDASKDEFLAEGVNGAAINDAVYNRNVRVEQMLGVKLDVVLCPETTDAAVNNTVAAIVQSGIHSYDIVTAPSYTQVNAVAEGHFSDLSGIPNLDLSQPYWVSGYNDIMNLNGRQYTCLGAYSISMIRMMNVIVYNKNLFEDKHIEDLYEIAKAGDWTLDKQIEIIQDTYEDSSGDSQRGDNDFYGFIAGGLVTLDPYLISSDVHILGFNASEGAYEFVYDKDKFISVVEKVHQLISKNPNTWSVGDTSAVDTAFTPNKMNLFAELRGLMVGATVYQIESVLTPSGFEGDYGIVPQPKYNKDQENYRTYVQDQMTVMAVVSTIPDDRLEMVGATMEGIAYESQETVFPAYYETSLSYRFLKNPESKYMIDLIYSNISLETAILYSPIFGMITTLRTMLRSDAQNPSTTLTIQSTIWKSKLKELNSKMENIIH